MPRTFVTCRRMILAIAVGIAMAPSAPAAGVTAVAVFNFQMKSVTPEWVWLEKGLADRLITDFHASQGVAVLDRDQMQKTAERMHWVPEMQTDVWRVPKLEFRAKYLISGNYEVADDVLTATAVVVDFVSQREVVRRTVSGPPGEALDLVRRLSGELLAWLVHRKPEEVLAELPAWTRSLPAARVLYEGVDLYDQGRYAEAWLKFRSAARDDPQYVDALYFVGKMYYFMCRYDHARELLAEYFYRAGRRHPRITEGIREYLHSYEQTSSPSDAMMSLYRQFYDRFATAPDDETGWNVKMTGFWSNGETLASWLLERMARLLEEQGRYQESMELATADHGKVWARYAHDSLCRCLRANHMTGGELFGIADPRLVDHWPSGNLHWGASRIVLFRTNASREVMLTRGGAASCWLAAPAGHVFRSLTFLVPRTGDPANRIGLTLTKDIPDDTLRLVRSEAELAGGVRVDGLPRTGLFRCKWVSAGPLHVRAELEPVGPHGQIDVICENTGSFRVEVDGHMGRQGPVLIGLLRPGEHRLVFRSARPDSPFGEFRTTAHVDEGRATSVRAKLPWKEGSRWASWRTALVSDGRGDHLDVSSSHEHEDAHVLAEDNALRVTWSQGDDLWHSPCRDDLVFEPARRLEMPLSSAWREWMPSLHRDESRRYWLHFTSDRSIDHSLRRYSCWSRDLVHWSAPALVEEQERPSPKTPADVWGEENLPAFDPAAVSRGSPLISRTLEYRPRVPMQRPRPDCRARFEHVVLAREDGRYEIYAVYEDRGSPEMLLCRWLATPDGRWSEPETIDVFDRYGERYESPFAVVRRNRRSHVIMDCLDGVTGSDRRALFSYTEMPDGTWQRSGATVGLPPPTHLAWHPRWGYIMTCGVPAGHEWFFHRGYGPLVMTGPDLEPLFSVPASESGAAPQEVPWPVTVRFGPDGRPAIDEPATVAAASFATFIEAIEQNDIGTVKATLEARPEWVRQRSEPLFRAVNNAHIDLVKAILEAGADPDAPFTWRRRPDLHEDTVSPLFEACTMKYPDLVALLLKHGARADRPSDTGSMAIHMASERGSLEAVQLLLRAGAGLDASGRTGTTPLVAALTGTELTIYPGDELIRKALGIEFPTENTESVARFLIDQGADLDAVNECGLTPLCLALAQRCSIGLIEHLLDKGSSITVRDQWGFTPLHRAAKVGNTEGVKLLIRRGAEVNARIDKGHTPLHVAAECKDDIGLDTAICLIANGADLRAQTAFGSSPLHIAVMHKTSFATATRIADAMVAAGVDIDMTNHRGWTSLHNAACHSSQMIKLLVARGANINARDHQGRTPLMHAVARTEEVQDPSVNHDRWHFADICLARGADVNARDSEGKTALTMAIEKGDVEAVRILREHGGIE